MRWRFCQRIEHRLDGLGIPLGDALLDKPNASYRYQLLSCSYGTLTALPESRTTIR